MGYWGNVARLAAKAATDDSKFHTANLATGLLVQGAIAGTIFVASGFTEASAVTRALTAATPFLTWPAAFLVRFVAVPPKLAAEAASEIKRLQPPTGPHLKGGFYLEPDTPLVDALHWAATGNWGEEESDATSPVFLGAFAQAIRQFEQLAADGQIRVWYRAFPGGVLEQLPKDTWKSCKLELLDLLGRGPRLHRRQSGEIFPAADIRVCKAQWEGNWAYLKTTVP